MAIRYSKRSFYISLLSAVLASLFVALPILARASLTVEISESQHESLQVIVSPREVVLSCTPIEGQLFKPELGIKQVSEHVYEQPLNSEKVRNRYFKAARMGRGIYIHLPYFIPTGDCRNAVFQVNARNILWNGKWHAGQITLPPDAIRNKSLFLTNEPDLIIRAASYFDPAIPAPTRARMEFSFDRITAFYREVLNVDPLEGVGVVVAIVRNNGNYSGFGGDALNIIRMSADNPTTEQIAKLDQLLPSTFVHELAHKLQGERIFQRPMARHIVEGGADFLRLIILYSAGMVDEVQAKDLVLQAVSDCGELSDTRSQREKSQQGALDFREPYDCGMVYYFVGFYSSGLSPWDFMDRLRKAMTGDGTYENSQASVCLLFEDSCQNFRLNGITGNRSQYQEQAEWLRTQLLFGAIPFLERR